MMMLGAFQILAGARIDLQRIALFDKGWGLYYGAGFQRDVL